MTADTITWNYIHDETLSDSEVKAEYDALSPEFKLAKTVIRLRDKVGLTQREFAAKVGMKQSQLARIETGKQKPKLITLAKLAAAADYRVEVNLIPIEKESES